MKGNAFCIFLACFLFLSFASFAQRQKKEEEDDYTREFVWGINKNTNGGYIGALNIKLSRRVQGKQFTTYGFEIANVKHPKEARIPALSGGSFILGKSNYLYAMRFSYGKELLLFRKAPQQGVQISALLSGGPTLGIIAPYYVEIGLRSGFTTTEQYNPNRHSMGNILGTGRPLEGIGESTIAPGLHVRTGLTFEFGTFKSNVSGIEVGVMVEGYSKEIQLMPRSYGQQFYPSAYLTLFHGSRR